ncbi:MAG: hypothetical protein JW703_02360 [Candidatus Diapherotrites archaeon]|nr:hypothetical protein [Candidatus Diapherotrites archaeon]
MKKGQISFEFIMLLLVLLFFMIAIITPTAQEAVNSMEDVSRVSQAITAAEKISSAVNYIASSGNGTIQKMNVFLPMPSKITIVNNKTLNLTVYTKTSMDSVGGCTGLVAPNDLIDRGYSWVCNKSIDLLSNTTPGLVASELDAINESKSVDFKIKKENNEIEFQRI